MPDVRCPRCGAMLPHLTHYGDCAARFGLDLRLQQARAETRSHVGTDVGEGASVSSATLRGHP